jgi:hypothetical protein
MIDKESFIEIDNGKVSCINVSMWKVIQVWIECKLSGTTKHEVRYD